MKIKLILTMIAWVLIVNQGMNSGYTIIGFSTREKCRTMGQLLAGGFFENFRCELVD